MTAFDDVFAETEPRVSTTVATANGRRLARKSWIASNVSLAKASIPMVPAARSRCVSKARRAVPPLSCDG